MAKRKLKQKATVTTKGKVKSALKDRLLFGDDFLKSHAIPMAIISLLAIVLYFRTVNYEFVLDDTLVITENQYVQEGISGIPKIFGTESFQGYFGEQKNLVQGSRYRPLSIATFAIERDIWSAPKIEQDENGDTIQEENSDPRPGHLINILFYIITCLLLYRLLVVLFPLRKKHWYLSIPFIAAILYVLHPTHVEAVANIKGRDEIMALMFCLAATLQSLRYISSKKWAWLGFACLSFFLGLLTKENTITFLAIIPITIYFFTKRGFKSLAIVTGSLLAVTIVYLCIRTSVIGFLMNSTDEITDIMNNPFYGMTSSQKFATVFYTLGEYLKLSFFPHPLTHDYYPYHVPIMNWTKFGSTGPLLLHLALAAACLYGLFKKHLWSYGIIFYFAALSIVCNLFVNVGTFMNERFLFAASVGICLFLAYLFIQKAPEWFGKVGKYVGIGFCAIWIAFFAYKSFTRVPVWENALTLNSAAVKVSKNSARSNSFMATALFNRFKDNGKNKEDLPLLNEAKSYADQALKIYPTYRNANLMKAGIAAEIYNIERDQNAILKAFKEVAAERPDIDFIRQYLDYLNPRANDMDGLIRFYNELGYNTLFLKKNNPSWAIEYLKMGLSLDANNSNLNQAIGECYESLGRSQLAAQHYNRIR